MQYSQIMYEEFGSAAVNIIPEKMDVKNMEKQFTFIYEPFAISAFDIYRNNAIMYEDQSQAMELYLFDRIRNYENTNGKIENVESKWILLYLFTIKRVAEYYGGTFMEKTIDMLISKVNEISVNRMMYYISNLNAASVDEFNVGLMPRPHILSNDAYKKIIMGAKFEETFVILPSILKVLKKRIAKEEIRDYSLILPPRFNKYIKAHELLAEYFIGLIILKRAVIIKNNEDTPESLKLKKETLEIEIERYIKSISEVSDEKSQIIKEELFDIIFNAFN